MSETKRACLFCAAPCRYVLCDACYAKTPHGEPEASPSRPASSGYGVGLPVSFENIRRF